MTAAPELLAGLYVDMESRPPRASYKCPLCGAREGPVKGRAKVAAFAADARITHQAACQPIHPNQRKAAAS